MYILRLLRIPYLFLIIFSVLTMSYATSRVCLDQTHTAYFNLEAILLAATAVFLAMASYIFNDIRDQAFDKENNAEATVIPEFVSPKRAYIFCICFFFISLATCICLHFVSSLSFILPIFGLVAGLILCYNIFVKEIPIISNLCWSIIHFSVLAAAFYSKSGAECFDVIVFSALILSFATLIYISIAKSLRDFYGIRELPATRDTKSHVVVYKVLLAILGSATLGLMIYTGSEMMHEIGGYLWIFLSFFIAIPMFISMIYGLVGRTYFEYGKASMWAQQANFAIILGLFLYFFIT